MWLSVACQEYNIGTPVGDCLIPTILYKLIRTAIMLKWIPNFNKSSILHILQIDIIVLQISALEIDIYNATNFSWVLYSFGQFEIRCSYKELSLPIFQLWVWAC